MIINVVSTEVKLVAWKVKVQHVGIPGKVENGDKEWGFPLPHCLAGSP
ncbi:MAG TPA: hypothetical protein VHK70_00245 [Burkholderiaceae bacterium]|jgi:hypothetical protein|nr:hypothetical protein [Burkholderiaceae bacterium]